MKKARQIVALVMMVTMLMAIMMTGCGKKNGDE